MRKSSMLKFFFITHVLLFFLSCSRFETVENVQTSGFTEEEKLILKNDIIWVSSFQSQIHHSLIQQFLSDLGSLRKAAGDCDIGQIACTKLFYPTTIFLTESFFKMTQSMRVSTLLHERAHHYYRYYSHDNCSPRGVESNYNCDVKMESAYGIEVQFYQVLLSRFPDNPTYKDELSLVSKFLKNNR
jgi:hypothetical protein